MGMRFKYPAGFHNHFSPSRDANNAAWYPCRASTCLRGPRCPASLFVICQHDIGVDAARGDLHLRGWLRLAAVGLGDRCAFVIGGGLLGTPGHPEPALATGAYARLRSPRPNFFSALRHHYLLRCRRPSSSAAQGRSLPRHIRLQAGMSAMSSQLSSSVLVQGALSLHTPALLVLHGRGVSGHPLHPVLGRVIIAIAATDDHRLLPGQSPRHVVTRPAHASAPFRLGRWGLR